MTSLEILSLISASAAIKNLEKFDYFMHQAIQKRISKPKIYEALLQNYLFCGFPNALFFLKRFQHLTDFKPKKYKTDFNKLKEKGIKTSKKIYGDKLPNLISNVKKFSPELSEWLIIEGYGKVISRPTLSIKEREACIISVLSVQMFEEQLKSHLFGGLKNGLTPKMIDKLISNLSEIGCEKEKQFAQKVFNKIKQSK
ncbi:MAG: hypothetical protein N3D80_06940 [Ignavibacterium album]|uniref:carboxymuconolactone decarboxylase family protein n=1 Tax=Ignavibacterium album TaxID=591197 RepID=UPI0026F09248|nr:hypothetical protein [Ignavibacterium album]MCX8105587.1 hypothetical protein [Ignavibacterium album]